jgi:hypothetical protein
MVQLNLGRMDRFIATIIVVASPACFEATRPPAAKASSLTIGDYNEECYVHRRCRNVVVGSANFAMAQSTPDLGASTGSEANRAAISDTGEYTGQ